MITFRKIGDDIFMVGVLDEGENSYHTLEAARQAYDMLTAQEKIRGRASLDSVKNIESVK